MQQLKENIFTLTAFNQLQNELSRTNNIHIINIAGSFRAFIADFVFERLNRPVLYIANDVDSAERMRDDLELLIGKDKVTFLQAIAFEPYDQAEPNPSLVSMRVEAMQNFIENDQWITVAAPDGILESFPRPEHFLDNQFYLKQGNSLHFNEFLQRITTIGFERTSIVEEVGQFSVRGGIIDIYTWNMQEPVRIELFGDHIESLRQFDVISQRSVQKIEEATILPNLDHKDQIVHIDDLIPPETILFIEDTQVLNDTMQNYLQKAQRIYQQNISWDIAESEPQELFFTPERLNNTLASHTHMVTDIVQNSSRTNIDFKVKPPAQFNGSIKLFIQYLSKMMTLHKSTQLIVQAANKEQTERLRDIIEEEEILLNIQYQIGTLHNGFVINQLNLELLTDHEIFNRFKRRKTYKRFKSGAYLRQLSSLNLYDYVVHIDYGIGQFLGLETIEFGSIKKDCLKIVYRDNDTLYVTVDNLSRVQKYSSEEGGKPKLTKLGSPEWERTKKRTKESLKKVAAELIRIYAARKAHQGFQFAPDGHWQKELEASFIYEETDDQMKSIATIKRDMEKEEPMDRLLCGDVGFGKTEVAIRAAFKSIMNGKQAAVLVPTTILAFQHFETFKDRMQEFPVNIEMLNRFRSTKQQKEIVEGMADGTVDIVIGTHRLLSQDIRFKDLGLLIIDEEQRFGVKHKEKLKKYRLSVDILSMTATPIPRTLHMALMGSRDLSNIDTAPTNRLPIHTEIINWDESWLYSIIMREIQRGGQVYFVHNRVETINAVRDTLQQLIPEARITAGHGQLPEKELEKVMLDFMNKKYDILVSSMIIENGLDIPNVNTIIINQAHKFGLAQLYQLRGRVGRSKTQAYAYLLVPPMSKITEIARKRLHAIQDFTDLGSGYKVALKDLEIRGAGNLLGKEQSGFVQTVGFDLYCKILDQAVKELKEGKPATDKENKQEDSLSLEGRYPDTKLDMDF
ncbi:MAG: transcription-repair coupling factor, partial [Caldithrix sp.]|nr:transcription-repair coupling factor [Caldithrix sp.]